MGFQGGEEGRCSELLCVHTLGWCGLGERVEEALGVALEEGGLVRDGLLGLADLLGRGGGPQEGLGGLEVVCVVSAEGVIHLGFSVSRLILIIKGLDSSV